MALVDLNKIKKGIQKSTDGIKKTAAAAAEKLPASVKEIQAGEAVKGLTEKGHKAFDSLISKGEAALAAQKEKKDKEKEAISSALEQAQQSEPVLSTKDVLRTVYALMAVDGCVSDEEKDKFLEIGQEADPEFETYRNELEAEIASALVPDPEYGEDIYDTVHNYVGRVIGASVNTQEGIRGKVLLWDLLAVAFSEGDYSANEKKLLRYIAKSFGVDYSVLLEMEQSVRTLIAIDREESWMKETDRRYTVIEERVNELADRKTQIMNGVRALLAD